MCDDYGCTHKYTAMGWVRLPVKFDIYARSYDEACERADTLANSKKQLLAEYADTAVIDAELDEIV